MTPLNEAEAGYLQSEFTRIRQNFNLLDLYGAAIVESILVKVDQDVVVFTQQESGVIQAVMVYNIEGLARLTDPRLQHILMHQNHQGFGAPGNPGPTNKPPSVGGNIATIFFNPGIQYRLCQSILGKLSGS